MRLLEGVRKTYGLMKTVGVIAALPFLWKRVCRGITTQNNEGNDLTVSEGIKISIVITVVDTTDHSLLDVCIQSILKQTSPNWELCICGDLSISEDLRRVLEAYKGVDERIRVVLPGGHVATSVASNMVSEQASGEFIGYLENVYHVEKNTIENIVNILLQKNIDYMSMRKNGLPDFQIMRKSLFWKLKGFKGGEQTLPSYMDNEFVCEQLNLSGITYELSYGSD